MWEGLRILAGFVVSVWTNFRLNEAWTWRDRRVDDALQFRSRMGKFYVVSSVAGLVQVAHNVHLGTGCQIGHQVGISGSTTLGERTKIGVMSGLAGHLQVGADVVVEPFSGLTRKKVPDGAHLSGYPARQVEADN